MRIAFLSPGSPDTPAAWSGTPYFCLRALREQFESVEPVTSPTMQTLLRGLRRAGTRLRTDPAREPLIARLYGLALRRQLDRVRPDVVFGLAASTQLAGLAADCPVVHCSDATFRLMCDYYPDWFAGLSPRSRRNGEAMERRAILGADLSLFPSDWAAASAVRDYGAAPARVHAVPFGANLATRPSADPFRRDGTCRLLFVGVDWTRKGGEVALAVLRGLQARGVAAELHVVGCAPPPEAAGPGLVAHGFLSKGDPTQLARLQALFSAAAFLIVPSRQEAYGLVFCEAGAYGLPSLATETGGIPTIVKPGLNGILAPPEAGPAPFIEAVCEHWGDPARYAALRERTFARARDALTWEAWGRRSAELIRQAARRKPAPALPGLAPATEGAR
ncbi:glycosyltransferase family 4 protein [Methylobacterium nodulans]|uniref:Glycosyl transferase group 1 n=1 Tax=Methylobacterium nodulans (strain LMG 21967 / CNCM I-2342 / ORS 2060) TaxID=460265 RepID=B8ISR7_METNO|nr:glycosyltransferase family 4 protein [Methylobacterium nodulans]ACL60716.1 glycosyl transferase group 1 [Methylobacterium nodulans ORS 2060]